MHDWDFVNLAVQVDEVKGNDVVCKIKNSATLAGSLFTLHVSQVHIDLPTLTDKDKEVSTAFKQCISSTGIFLVLFLLFFLSFLLVLL